MHFSSNFKCKINFSWHLNLAKACGLSSAKDIQDNKYKLITTVPYCWHENSESFFPIQSLSVNVITLPPLNLCLKAIVLLSFGYLQNVQWSVDHNFEIQCTK